MPRKIGLFQRAAISLLCAAALLPIPLICGCGLPGPDGPAGSYGLDFSLPQGSRTDGAIIFIVDGMHSPTFQSMLQAGQLPAIKKYFIDRGLYVPRAVTCNPSITMSLLTSIVTGLYPPHHGLVAPKWFDRNKLIFRNYETFKHKNLLDQDHQAATIYEQFPDRLTFSLFLQPHRGATKFFENTLTAGPAMFFGLYELIDRITLWRFNQVMQISRQYRQFPAVTTVYLLAVNFRAYSSGLSSQAYRDALAHTDRQIGRVVGDIERAGLLDKIILVLTADHGHADTPNHPGIEGFIRKDLGVNMGDSDGPDESTPFEKRLAEYNKYSAIPYGAGDRYEVLYLRRPIWKDGKCAGFEPWTERPTPQDIRKYPTRSGGTVDLPAALAGRKEIDATAYLASPGVVRLVTKTGEVEFTRDGGMYSCRVVSGTDPLGWAGKVSADALAGRPMTGRQWLAATINTEFPDLPESLVAYFDGLLAADVVAFPAPLCDIDGWRKAGHGGIRATEMILPIVIAGPGVPHGSTTTARIVDIMPTVLELLGRPVPPGLDGRSIIRQFQSQSQPPATAPAGNH
ncbi:MAG: alkaline phosphatase family protein [Planctomycetes bacterium]|nr:alkaline phosphatase family protein [Planctomycetota bacterium]